jgi:hypothetical protein
MPTSCSTGGSDCAEPSQDRLATPVVRRRNQGAASARLGLRRTGRSRGRPTQTFATSALVSAIWGKADPLCSTRGFPSLTQMYGPAVRCKRFRRSGSTVLHQCIRSLLGALLLPTIMDISAHATSLADRPRPAIWVTSVRMRREDRSSAIRAISMAYRLIGRPSPNQSPHRLAVSGPFAAPNSTA